MMQDECSRPWRQDKRWALLSLNYGIQKGLNLLALQTQIIYSGVVETTEWCAAME